MDFNDISGVTVEPGAYTLLIDLPAGFLGTVGALGVVDLAAGSYLYLGSANGPGGLRARIARHCRPQKTRHWHVDYLTTTGTVEQVFVLPGGSECDLTQRALTVAGVSAPHPGFGSSDCRSCPAHLLQISPSSRDKVLDRLRACCAAEMEVGDD